MFIQDSIRFAARIGAVVTFCLVCGFAMFRVQPIDAEDATPEASSEGSYASVNGLEMYYEVHGTGGTPLILIHGGLGGTVDFSALIPVLSQSRQVIAIELQGHGHTADIDRPFSFEAMADDVAALIDTLELGQTDVLGFSLGGGVALRTAIQHPDKVRNLVLLSTVFQREGWHEEVLAGTSAMNAQAAAMMLETPMYQFYAGVAPDLEAWPSLIAKTGELLSQDYDWSAEVAALPMPVLLVVSDADSVRLDHAIAMFELLGGNVAGDFGSRPASQLTILPNTGHYFTLFRTDLLGTIIPSFLDTPVASAVEATPEA